jgi:hypothetical protein
MMAAPDEQFLATGERRINTAPPTLDAILRHGIRLLSMTDTPLRVRPEIGALAGQDPSVNYTVQTYYGTRPFHEVLERTAWHAAQHTRQVMLMLGSHGIEPDGPLTAADLEGLPVPHEVWDRKSSVSLSILDGVSARINSPPVLAPMPFCWSNTVAIDYRACQQAPSNIGPRQTGLRKKSHRWSWCTAV